MSATSSNALSRVGQQIQNQSQADANRASRSVGGAAAPSRVGIVENTSGSSNRPNVGSEALSPIGQQSFDSNDQIFEAADFGYIFGAETNRGAIDKSTDVDMFKINVVAGEQLTFDVDSTNAFDSVIRLFDSQGKQIAINDDGAAPGESTSLQSFIDYTFATGGTFYVGVSGYGNSQYNAATGHGDAGGRTGNFTLRISEAAVAESPVTHFDTESNNSRPTANNIGVFTAGYHSRTFYGSTGSGSDTQDWTRFRIDGTTNGTIQLSGIYQDLDIALYDSTGTRIASSVNGDLRTDTISLSNMRAGTYYIQVFPGVRGARSAYALRFGFRVS
ncbi:MAG: pre-peptidase C-terminal domain-containing protein [Planctomycetaceae bacterium]